MSDDEDKRWQHRIMKAMMAVCIGMMILCGLVIAHIFFPKEAHGQTLSVPLPPGCTAPTIAGTVVSCGGTPPPVCQVPPPVCPGTVPAGCAPCTPPPAVSCGDLRVVEAGAFTFSPQTTWDMALGNGEKEVWIASYTATAADVGKKSHTSMAEHTSDIHYKTVWASKIKCKMTDATLQAVNSAPNVYVSVGGVEPVNMAPGETWYFMYRAINKTGKNSCINAPCGNRFTAYNWSTASTMSVQRGGPIPSDKRKKVTKKK
jgi:hypothetical protein